MKINGLNVFLVALLACLLSCDEDDFLDKTVIDKIVFHENADQVGVFKYLKTGRIKTYEYHFDNVLVQYTDYKYDGNNLVAKIYYEITNSGTFEVIAEDSFTYNSDGAIQTAIIDKARPTQASYAFTWANGNLSRIDRSSSSLGAPYHSFSEIVYDAHGNALKETYYNLVNDIAELSYLVAYEYDDKINPLREFADPFDVVANSPNNVVKKIQRSTVDSEPYAVTDITYNYDSDMPILKDEKINLYSDVTEIQTKFFYRKI